MDSEIAIPASTLICHDPLLQVSYFKPPKATTLAAQFCIWRYSKREELSPKGLFIVDNVLAQRHKADGPSVSTLHL